MSGAVTLGDMIREAKRELQTRRKVYPGWISKGTIERRTADHRIRVQAAIVAHLEAEQAGGDDGMIPGLLAISEPER